MSKLVCLKRIIDGGLRRLWGSWGKAASRWEIFCEKLAIFMPLDHNLHVLTTILKN